METRHWCLCYKTGCYAHLQKMFVTQIAQITGVILSIRIAQFLLILDGYCLLCELLKSTSTLKSPVFCTLGDLQTNCRSSLSNFGLQAQKVFSIHDKSLLGFTHQVFYYAVAFLLKIIISSEADWPKIVVIFEDSSADIVFPQNLSNSQSYNFGSA